MIPILYPETETEFDSNGLGFLSDTTKARVLEKLNGTFELELTYPLTGLHADGITDRCVILAKPDPVSDPQPFRVYRINPVSKGTMKVYAQHIAYDLTGIPVSPFTAASAADAMAQIGSAAAVECPFTFSTDKTTAATLTNAVPKSIWKLLGGSQGSILDVYGGEYEFNRYRVNLLSRRGADRGVSIRYGKNLSTLEQDRNCASVYTGVYPFWVSTEGELVQLTEKVLHAEGTYSFTRILDLDLSDKFQEKPTEAQLRTRAQQYMTDNQIGVPNVSWKVQFVPLHQTEEYKTLAILEQVLMGDILTVVFPQMNVNASARVVETDFDPILEKYNSVTLGRVKTSLADTIAKQNQAIQDQQQEISKKPSASEITGLISGKLNEALSASGGSVRLLDTDGDGKFDELYIADHEDPEQAVKVWRFNYQGWAASKTGYNGPFTFGATLEDGLLADFVTAARLVAGTIQSQDGESFFLDLDNGILRIKSQNTTVDGESIVKPSDLAALKNQLDNSVTLVASSQVFVKAAGAADYSPAKITLTAESSGNLTFYTWYKEGAQVSLGTLNTLTVKPSDISGKSATYKVIATDEDGKEYTDSLSIAKLSDGENGSQGANGIDGKDGADGYTTILSNEFIEIPVDTGRYPAAAKEYDCQVKIYKGTAELTPVSSAPGNDQFSVAVSGSYSGLTITQPTAGTIRLAVAEDTAIEDFTQVQLSITLDSGLVLEPVISVSVNMNSDLSGKLETNITEVAALKLNNDSISAEVSRVEATTQESLDGVREDVYSLSQKVSATMTAEDVRIEIREELKSGVDSVETATGYTFNADGMNIKKDGSEMDTTISEDGMSIKKNDVEVLRADHTGVRAVDLKADTYLIVGGRSRFENYGDGWTGCFWIGGQ